MKVVDVVEDRLFEMALAPIIQKMIESEPIVVSDVTIVTNQPTELYSQTIEDTCIRVTRKDLNEGPVDSNCHLVIGYGITRKVNADVSLQNLKTSVRENCFILLEENFVDYDESEADNLFEKVELTCISKQRSNNSYFILLRSASDITTRNKIVINMTSKNFMYINALKTALANAEKTNTYVYIIGEEEFLGAVGFLNCIKNEEGGKFARLFFLQDSRAEKFSFSSKFYSEQLNKDLISNVYHNGTWGSFRHLKLNPYASNVYVEHAYVNALVKGNLSSLCWIESSLMCQLPDSKDRNVELCSVYYAPINFRDVMLSSGKLPADALPGDLSKEGCPLGLEFAGRDSTGKRIMAMVGAKSLATTCVARRNLIWDIPDNWTMLQASTVPCVYLTAYYALVVRGKIRYGESILIHAGSSGVGQAAISVALYHKLTVFTTVGSKEKREFLKKVFPQLTDANIGNSRDTSFEQFVMRVTRGRGVDLVLNSLSEEKLQASVRCLGLNGRFLEIGKIDLDNDSPLGMSIFLKNTSFHGIMLDSVIESDNETVVTLVNLVAEGIKTGAVRPLPTIVFNENQVVSAFRFMASGKHIGKVVIQIRDEEECNRMISPPKVIEAVPRTYFHSEKSYIIVGGLGGIGLELADWMITRGAKKLILTSRIGIKTAYQSFMVRRWRHCGVTIIIDTNDFLTLEGATNLFKESVKVAPVGGIFNLATLTNNTLFENQTVEDFKRVAAAKIDGTLHLDIISRDFCPTLDYFICFSSVASGRGNIGQTSYGLANSAMERICENRSVAGLPGLAIQWGAIGDVGLVVDKFGAETNTTDVAGTMPQPISSVLRTLDLFLRQPNPVLASSVISEKRKFDRGVTLVSSIANILGFNDLKNVPDDTSFGDLGVDSLMGIEIKQTLERNYDIVLNGKKIHQLSFGKLKAIGKCNINYMKLILIIFLHIQRIWNYAEKVQQRSANVQPAQHFRLISVIQLLCF